MSKDGREYTDPALRDRLKEEIRAGDKGSRPGQWSARKSQLLVHEYEKAGGGYTSSKRTDQQKSLEQWGSEAWTTKDGKPAIRGETTKRYLPKEAWEKLTPEESAKTDQKKASASQRGTQFVANTEAAKRARKSASRPASKAAKG